MSQQIVYLDRFRIREGRLEDFKRYANEYSEFVEEKEPGVISFNFYVGDDGTDGTAVFVFSDAHALDDHLDVASSRFQEGYELLSATAIELLGRASERAVEMAESFDANVKAQELAGFSRYDARQEMR